MHHYLYLLWPQPEKPLRLYHLETLVHQRGGVYRNLRPHVPCRVLERVSRTNSRQLLLRICAERPPRCREYHLLHLVLMLPHDALEYRPVFRVYRQYACMMLLHEPRNQLPGHYERLLVREGYLLARLYRRYRRTQAGVTHHGRHHCVYAPHRRRLRYRLFPRKNLYRQRRERILHLPVMRLVRDDHNLRHEPPRLLYEPCGIVVRRQCIHLEKLLIACRHIKRLCAYRPRRPQYGEPLPMLFMLCHKIRIIRI